MTLSIYVAYVFCLQKPAGDPESVPADDAEMPAAEEQEDEDEVDLDVFSLKILPLTHELHQKHGLRHNDYQRYRGYCSR